ncbi:MULTISPECIES: hypothetical protein [unclassified Tenacibaculum]|uniref:hypothetical protein n=1 Tax=unclassified Tenacibaculum TaxID=2635139 RepID=UPI001F4627FC|nr:MULTISPECIES: hypothetical protein [unclassified Tenacibaculum]MCF2875274.1 hypothetical protein [Tenacibaculum sp. Cn5-1]MCF2935350.1 hypothetical protein [Tenacibaculum sp. Cn5-34]MCG7511910.1 hypothetical protein [Tenacibaculum sp. Cn5-46]
MTIAEALQGFYTKNNLLKNGGEDENTFELKFKLFTLKLPNSQFRKDIIHIHDIQHVLYNCDTTWKGEAFIAGWEIATGMWKKLPIGIISTWAMGFSLLNYPKDVYRGYKAGLKVTGIIDLNLSKEELLKLSIEDLKKRIKKEGQNKMNFTQTIYFIFWILFSLFIFSFPFSLFPLLFVF